MTLTFGMHAQPAVTDASSANENVTMLCLAMQVRLAFRVLTKIATARRCRDRGG